MYSTDEEAIRRRAEQCAETWNRHDMSTFASLFTEDSDYVTPGGDWLRGRDEIEQHLVKVHALWRIAAFQNTTIEPPPPDLLVE